MELEIRLFGSTEVRASGVRLGARDLGGVKHRHILQLLTLHKGLSKGELAELLWEGNPPSEYVATLESYVSGLRRRLDPDSPARHSVVLTRTGGYVLDGSRVNADVWRFAELMSAAAGAPTTRALALLDDAVRLADDPLLAGESLPVWAVDAREQHRIQLIAAATRAGEHALCLGDLHRANELAGRATDLDPLAEAAWRVRISARYGDGDRAGALRCYQACRRALGDELGIEPAAATQQLFVQILGAGEVPASQEFGHAVAAILAAARNLAAVEAPGDVSAAPVLMLLDRAERLARGAPIANPTTLRAIA
jgi:DNA-binding SARP family transcriptional activator